MRGQENCKKYFADRMDRRPGVVCERVKGGAGRGAENMDGVELLVEQAVGSADSYVPGRAGGNCPRGVAYPSLPPRAIQRVTGGRHRACLRRRAGCLRCLSGGQPTRPGLRPPRWR
jgi:hypothetical protein